MIEDAIILALKYLLYTIPFIIIGVISAELIITLKFIDKIVWITKPITEFAHLQKECGASFLTAFASAAAANSMLMEFYNKKIINKKELIISSLANSFPAILLHWKYILPVIVPLLGITGIIYFCALVAVGFIKTTLVLIVGRILLPKREYNSKIKKERSEKIPIKDAFKISLKNSKNTIINILKLMIPLTIIFFILIDIGVFDMLADYLKGVAKYLPIPVEGLTIIAAQFANSVAAYTIAGNLLSGGVLNSKEIVLTLLIGNVLTEFILIFRSLIPYYFGIFGVKLGTEVLVIATALRTAVTILVIILLALLW